MKNHDKAYVASYSGYYNAESNLASSLPSNLPDSCVIPELVAQEETKNATN